jgi:hypothetical protein
MVVSCLPAGCHVDASASRPLDSASANLYLYYTPPISFLMAPLFPFASASWLVVAPHLLAPPPPCINFLLHSRLSRPSLPPPCCLHCLDVASYLVASPQPLDPLPAHVLPLVAPPPHICQLALSCTAIFVEPSLDAAAITGVLKCIAHPPGGGIASGYCPPSFGSCPPTRAVAPSHRPFCFRREGKQQNTTVERKP